ncbi:MAG: class I SAM-dependent methyltransferase [Chloroflexi bacterium]|nr:class I SAM-dependent methyltransferase [Chloroflexota bacterium]
MDPEQYRIMYEAEDRHWWYVGMRGITFALLDQYVPPGSARRVLDAGCGAGANLEALRRYGPTTGVDISPLALELARTRPGARLTAGSIDRLPFADGVFDLVTCFDVIYHLQVQEDAAALREFRRVLRPGGVLFLRAPAFELLRAAHDTAVHTRQRYQVGPLRAKIEAAGFGTLRATYANTLLFPLAAGMRLAQRLTGHSGDHEGDVKPAAPPVNAALRGVLGAEALLLRRFDFPVGVSAVCVARAI